MHELSIAMEIFRIVKNDAIQQKGTHVSEIELDIGLLSGVDIENLSFVMENITTEPLFKGCHTQIHTIQPRAKCEECGKQFPVNDLYQPCPHCLSAHTLLQCGNELKVKTYVIN